MNNNRRNLHIIIYSSFPRYSGGRENWLYNVLPYIAKEFNKVFIYVIKSSRPIYYDLEGISNVQLKSVATLSSYGMLYMLVNRFLFQSLFFLDTIIIFRSKLRSMLIKEIIHGDTILAMNSISELLPAIDVKKIGINFRLISSVRGLVPEEYGERIPILKHWFCKLEKECLTECDIVLANGYDTQDYLSKLGVRCFVIPNGVDIARFKNANTNSEDLNGIQKIKDSGTKIIVMVATLRKIKGTDNLLEVADRLLKKGQHNFIFIFVGKGNQTFYKNKAKALGIQDYVLFVGEQKNVPGYLALADVVICISGGGGMSMSALEAMAAGKPIVAWDTPVYQQLIVNMQEGYLVKYPDLDELAEGINFVLENPEMAAMFAANAQQKVNQYDWPNVSRKLLEKLV